MGDDFIGCGPDFCTSREFAAPARKARAMQTVSTATAILYIFDLFKSVTLEKTENSTLKLLTFYSKWGLAQAERSRIN